MLAVRAPQKNHEIVPSPFKRSLGASRIHIFTSAFENNSRENYFNLFRRKFIKKPLNLRKTYYERPRSLLVLPMQNRPQFSPSFQDIKHSQTLKWPIYTDLEICFVKIRLNNFLTKKEKVNNRNLLVTLFEIFSSFQM